MKGFGSRRAEEHLFGRESRFSHKAAQSEGVGKGGRQSGWVGDTEPEDEKDAGLKALSCSRHHSSKSYAMHLKRLEIELIQQLNR